MNQYKAILESLNENMFIDIDNEIKSSSKEIVDENTKVYLLEAGVLMYSDDPEYDNYRINHSNAAFNNSEHFVIFYLENDLEEMKSYLPQEIKYLLRDSESGETHYLFLLRSGVLGDYFDFKKDPEDLIEEQIEEIRGHGWSEFLDVGDLLYKDFPENIVFSMSFINGKYNINPKEIYFGDVKLNDFEKG